MRYSISDVANFTGQTIRTLRYYDEIGLLSATRLSNDHRAYYMSDILKLEIIIALKKVDFSLDDIKLIIQSEHDISNLLSLQEDLLVKQKENLESKIENIRHLKSLKNKDEIESTILERLINIEDETIIHKVQDIIKRNEFEFDDYFKKIYLKRKDNEASKKIMKELINELNLEYANYFDKNEIVTLSMRYLEADAQRFFSKYEKGFNNYLSDLLLEISKEYH